MQLLPASAYAFLLVGLTVKYALLLALQGTRRMRVRVFRWPEDAAQWHGKVGSEEMLVERAQAALRNDGESQPLFLAAAAFWLWSGASGVAALIVCGGYLITRALHSALLIWPRQPLRNRVFGLSQLCLVVVLVDSYRLLWGRFWH